MQPILDFQAHNWWLVIPLSGVMGGWARSWQKSTERRHQRRVELYKLRNQSLQAEQVADAEVASLMATHDELEVGKLIDFPLTTDGLRPDSAKELTAASRLAAYRAAVNSYDVAFSVAEREARRIRDTNFSGPERERLATARKLLRLAEDSAATPAERQAAYKRARRELDGLIVLPVATVAALEEEVAPMLDSGQTPDFPQR